MSKFLAYTQILSYLSILHAFSARKAIFPFILTSLANSYKGPEPSAETSSKELKYWSHQSVPETIDEADRLFEERKYLEVYELLNRLKFNNNAQVQWRIGRVLFKMCTEAEMAKAIKREMILEAYDILTSTVQLVQDDPNVHKWLALVTYMKTGMETPKSRLESYPSIKHHLLRTVELQPDDVVALYLLGKLCYEFASMSWMQRKIIEALYGDVLRTSYIEAVQYFNRAEEVRPRFYQPNLYMLGKTFYHLKQYFRANYYLSIAAHLPAKNEYERRCAKDAKELVDILREYDLSENAVFTKLRDS